MLRKLCLIPLLLIVLLLPQQLRAESEEILSYIVSLSVEPDGDLMVVETIQIRALGQQIRHGIYRDYPTTYQDKYGVRVKVDFDLISAKRDGRPENSRITPWKNGYRVFLGDENQQVPPGLHSYELAYRTSRQLGFFPDHDELLYNAIPFGWDFPIRNASVVVELPADIPTLDIKAGGFTGPTGSTQQNFKARVRSADYIQFDTTTALGPHEGLTIFLSWPKGFVHEPTQKERNWNFASDNADTLVLMSGLLALLLYYYLSWTQVGRDPVAGTIIPLYDAPEGLSPEEGRYILHMGFDSRCLASVVMQLAIKGYLRIHETDGKYQLLRTDNTEVQLTSNEKSVAESLFGLEPSVTLEKSNHQLIRGTLATLKKNMQVKHLNRTFFTNQAHLVTGIGMTVCIAFLALAVNNFHADETASLLNALLYFSHIALIFIFAWLLKAPSRVGRHIMDRLEGYKMYLGTAERESLNLINLPQLSPDLYEKHLPWALALGLDGKWTKIFERELQKAGMDPEQYRPAWYHGSRHWNDAGFFNHGFAGSFASAIAASANPPGSGGGSAGSGGGGGGGGGW